jgi:hypothetical protein
MVNMNATIVRRWAQVGSWKQVEDYKRNTIKDNSSSVKRRPSWERLGSKRRRQLEIRGNEHHKQGKEYEGKEHKGSWDNIRRVKTSGIEKSSIRVKTRKEWKTKIIARGRA